jgi:YgiT-type zinc finger domain-containing protein
MQCDFCDGETKPRRVRKQHWFRGRLYVVENVVAEVCSECGQRYFHARTLDEIDTLLSGDHEVRESLDVEVVSM